MIISPLFVLRDSVDNISVKNLELRYPARKDEIGQVAYSVADFLDRLKKEFEEIGEKSVQRHISERAWWEAILKTTLSKKTRAMVVDEDNSVFFANFTLPNPDPGKKLHILDVVDSQQQDVLRLIGTAMENPRNMVEGETIFKGEKCAMRAVQLYSEENMTRTLILFEPKKP